MPNFSLFQGGIHKNIIKQSLQYSPDNLYYICMQPERQNPGRKHWRVVKHEGESDKRISILVQLLPVNFTGI